MKPTRPSDVVALLRQLDFHPSRILGQNFLIDGNSLDIILDAAAPTSNDIILEVGAGLGVLTSPLVESAGKVIAVEKDERLWTYLETAFAGELTLELVLADVLDLDLDALFEQGVNKVVANLPYVIASRFLVDVAFAVRRPERIVVLVQKEVGDRFAAKPDTKDFGLLSVFTQHFYDVKIRKVIPPTCFHPRPKIKSALVVMERRTFPLVELADVALYRSLVKHTFSQRRKQLGTILRHASGALHIEPAELALAMDPWNVSPHDRPGTLSPQAFAQLANLLAERQDSPP